MPFEILNWEHEATAFLVGEKTNAPTEQIVRHLLPWAQAGWRAAEGAEVAEKQPSAPWTRASFDELLSFFWRAIWAFSGAAFLAALCLTVPVGLLVLVGMWITR